MSDVYDNYEHTLKNEVNAQISEEYQEKKIEAYSGLVNYVYEELNALMRPASEDGAFVPVNQLRAKDVNVTILSGKEKRTGIASVANNSAKVEDKYGNVVVNIIDRDEDISYGIRGTSSDWGEVNQVIDHLNVVISDSNSAKDNSYGVSLNSITNGKQNLLITNGAFIDAPNGLSAQTKDAGGKAEGKIATIEVRGGAVLKKQRWLGAFDKRTGSKNFLVQR